MVKGVDEPAVATRLSCSHEVEGGYRIPGTELSILGIQGRESRNDAIGSRAVGRSVAAGRSGQGAGCSAWYKVFRRICTVYVVGSPSITCRWIPQL